MASPAPQETRVALWETVQVLHDHLTASLCHTVFQQTRTTERERHWTLAALAEFWTAVIVRAPHSLTPAWEAAAAGTGTGWPAGQATPEAFFERCPGLHGRFFAALYAAFMAQVLPGAPGGDAQPLHPLRKRCAEVWVVEGSRLAAVAHRLKLRHDGRAPVLPGCLTAFYELSRGMPRHLDCDPAAAAGELPRAIAALAPVPRDTLGGGDRLYGVGAFFTALTTHGLWGGCRRHARQSWRWGRDLRQVPLAAGTLWETVVELPQPGPTPPPTLRWMRWRRGRTVHALLTNGLDPRRLAAADPLALYPWRWKVARRFFDLKEVLHLHRWYLRSPNGVAMQVDAAAMVHTAFRGAHGRVAAAVGVAPEAISPAKFFPRVAVASIGLTWTELAFRAIQQATPGVSLQKPTWQDCPLAWTTLDTIRVEVRQGRRKKRRFCPSRKPWKSFAHIPGGKKLT